MAIIKQFGLSGVGSDLQLGKNGGRLVYNAGSGLFSFFANDGNTLEEIVVSGITLGTSTSIVEILDQDDFGNVSATGLATSESTKAYIDQVTNNGGISVSTDSGSPSSGSIIFASETFELTGNANNIITSWEGTNTVRIALTEDPKVFGNLEVAGDNITLTTGTYLGNANLNVVEFNSLSGTGAVTITDILDDDTMANASATTLATSESIKTYIDTELTSGGLAMTVAGDTGNGTVIFSSEVFTFNGTTNQISVDFDGVQTFTASLPADVVAPGSLTVTTDFTTSLTADSVPIVGTGGLLTEDSANISFTSATGTLNTAILSFGTLTDGVLSITSIKDEDTMVSDLANAIPTQQSVKTYVDTEILKVDEIIINGGTGQGTVNWYANEELSIIGTNNEIETNMTNQTLQIGLPNDVSINNNLTVIGTLLSNDITSTAISIDGDATVTGNLTVNGTTTVVNSTEVDIADAVIRVNSDGAAVSAGLEANIAGVIESVLYVPGSSRWELSGNVYTDENLAVVGTGDFGGVEFDNLSGTGAVSVTDILDEDTMSSDSDTVLATQQSIKAYVDSQIGATRDGANISLVTDTDSDGLVNVFNEELRLLGGDNITTSISDGTGGNVVIISLDDSISTGNVTVTGTTQFATLSDGTDSINQFITEADGITGNDNDTSVPTTAAIIDYIGNNAGDGLLLRNVFTADSVESNISLGLAPSVTARTYYATKVVVTVETGFSGGSVNQLIIKDNNGTGNTLVAANDTDIAQTGVYLIEQDQLTTLTKGQNIVLYFYESNGTTEAVPTAGQVTASVYYNWII